MPVYVISYTVEWNLAGTWTTIPAGSVLDVSGAGEVSANSENPAGFGDQAITHCSIELLRTATAGITLTRLPIRVTFTVGAGSLQAFSGVIESWAGDLVSVKLECTCIIQDLPNRTKDLYSPAVFRRPVATATSASSIEDPTNGSYAAGLINWILWQAGGRPSAQSGSYAGADFYYSCEQALRAPDWAWVAGEDGWAEALRLARCAGGQLYQGTDGVVAYRQPLTMVGTPSYTFTASVYADVEEAGSTGQYAGTLVCSFTPRQVRPMQEILDDTTPRVVEPGATLPIALEPKWPLKSLEVNSLGTVPDAGLTIVYFDGRPAAYSATTGYTSSVVVAAQQVTLTIVNHTTWPMAIYHIVLKGEPIVSGEVGSVTSGSGEPTKQMEDNIFVQNKAHAQWLADMSLAVSYGTVHPLRLIKDCPYDTNRTLGETVNLTATELSLSAAPHITVNIEHSDTGATSNYTLLDAAGLPIAADFYIVGTTSYTGLTKLVAW